MEAFALINLRVRDNVGPVFETRDFPATLVVEYDAVKLLAVEHFLPLENIGVFLVDSCTGSVVFYAWLRSKGDHHPLCGLSMMRRLERFKCGCSGDLHLLCGFSWLRRLSRFRCGGICCLSLYAWFIAHLKDVVIPDGHPNVLLARLTHVQIFRLVHLRIFKQVRIIFQARDSPTTIVEEDDSAKFFVLEHFLALV